LREQVESKAQPVTCGAAREQREDRTSAGTGSPITSAIAPVIAAPRPYPPTRPETLAPEDELIELNVSSEARRKDTSMPSQWRMRAIRYQRRGFKPQLLLTSLLDPKRYPADEVVALYHERWRSSLDTTRSSA
jgi:hypothetical protein